MPSEFFQAIGEPDSVVKLNEWTGRQLEERRGRSVQDLLDEWKASAEGVTAMMRGEKPWPDDSLPFADRILVTDAAVHQQDIFGALGIDRDRDGAPIRVGLKTYVVGIAWRLGGAGLQPLGLNASGESYTAGDGEPAATVRSTRFELFRATSGRRSPEQIAAYDWDGDPDPYIPYFYPYGIRKDALVE